MESLFNKIAWIFIEKKKLTGTDVFCAFYQLFKNTFFTEPLRVTTSSSSGRYLKTY